MPKTFERGFQNSPGPFSNSDADEVALAAFKRIVLTLVAIHGVIVLAWIRLLMWLLNSLF
jgi:hypothetical protein